MNVQYSSFKVGSHEECASRCCNLVDELRDRKGELCDKIKAYFIEYKEKVREHEEQLQQEILKWYNKQFELIKNAQKKEERRIEKVCACEKIYYLLKIIQEF